jgi:AraC-like DNA-binding protein
MLESRASPQILSRSARAIRSDQVDHYIIRVQKAGNWTGDFGGHVVAADPGSVMVLDMARASHARTTAIENVNLLLPRDTLDDLLTPFDMHGLVLQGSMAALLRSHLSELAANLSHIRISDAQRIAGATLNLVAACLAPSRDAGMRAAAPLEAALIAEIRRYINRHLHSPALSPQSICEALGLSRSRLYAICEPLGGVAAFIQMRRLRRIHAILTDRRDRRRIAEIAYQHGFVNEAHFSRAFRRAFGYSPREAREIGAAPKPDPRNGSAAGGGSGDYETWLRQLGG